MRARSRPNPRLALAALPFVVFFVVSFGALAAGGCDWRTFDSIQDHTPVLAVGAPSQFGADDFGSVVLPIATLPTGAKGSRYVVSAAGVGALDIVDIAATGAATSQNVSLPNAGGDAITALAEVVGTNQVLLGAPGGDGASGSVSLMLMGADALRRLVRPGVDGGSLRSRRRGGPPHRSRDASTSSWPRRPTSPSTSTATLRRRCRRQRRRPTCPMLMTEGLPRDRLRRAVLVAPLADPPGARQIVVGTPSLTDAGAVNVFTVDASGVATCTVTYRAADPRFGHALATGDFDGDGTLDLLIGSPPSHAFWIKGPLTPASAVLPVTLAPGVGELGAAVAAVNVDGKGGDEALVGNSDATVGSDALAGEVRVVTGPTLGTELAPLRRHDPSGADMFGIAVAALPFFCHGSPSGCGAGGADGGLSTPFQNLALVGSGAHAFTYFKFSAQSPDPRTP